MRKLFVDIYDMDGFAIAYTDKFVRIYDYSGNVLTTYYN